MKNINGIKFDDFYYNGHWASEYGVNIGGQNGISDFSLLPSKEVQTQTIIGRHGALVVGQRWNPRTFTIPIFIKDLNKIRDIARWLSSMESSYFYFKNDTLKIKCTLDDTQSDLQTGIADSLVAGVTDIKFIAYEPFYELITDKYYSITTFTSATTFVNDGNLESQPLLKITGSGDIKFKINGQILSIKAVSGSVYIDMKYYTVYQSSTVNKLGDYEGSFITLTPGNNTFEKVSGTITKFEVWCRSLFI